MFKGLTVYLRSQQCGRLVHNVSIALLQYQMARLSEFRRSVATATLLLACAPGHFRLVIADCDFADERFATSDGICYRL